MIMSMIMNDLCSLERDWRDILVTTISLLGYCLLKSNNIKPVFTFYSHIVFFQSHYRKTNCRLKVRNM